MVTALKGPVSTISVTHTAISTPTSRDVLTLDVLTLIFQNLHPSDIITSALTCKQWRFVARRSNATLWKFITQSLKIPQEIGRPDSLLRPLCEAVHRRSIKISRNRNICPNTTLRGQSPIACFHLAVDETLYTTHRDDYLSVKIWKCNAAGSRECVETLLGHAHVVFCLELAADGTLFTGSHDNTVKIWKCNAGGKRECIETLAEHTGFISCLKLAPDGTLYTGSSDNRVKIWKCNREGRRECVDTLEHIGDVCSLHLAADGTLYTGSRGTTTIPPYIQADNGTVKIWKCNPEGRRECTETLKTHTDFIRSLHLAADGMLYVGSNNGTVQIWKCNAAGKRECVETLAADTKSISSFHLAADETLYTGSYNGTVKIWKCNTEGRRECVETLMGQGSISDLYFAADGTLYTQSISESIHSEFWRDGIQIWNLSGSKQVALWQMAQEFRAYRLKEAYPRIMRRFDALSAATRNPIYGALYRLKPPVSTEQNVFNYGEVVFHNRDNFNTIHNILITNEERAQAIENYLAGRRWGAREIALEFARINKEDLTSRQFLLAQFATLPVDVKNAVYGKLFHLLKPKEHGVRFGECAFLDQEGQGSHPWQKSQAMLEVIGEDPK